MRPTGIRSEGPKGKFSMLRCVCAPQLAVAGTSMGPIESVSVRVAGMTGLRNNLPSPESLPDSAKSLFSANGGGHRSNVRIMGQKHQRRNDPLFLFAEVHCHDIGNVFIRSS